MLAYRKLAGTPAHCHKNITTICGAPLLSALCEGWTAFLRFAAEAPPTYGNALIPALPKSDPFLGPNVCCAQLAIYYCSITGMKKGVFRAFGDRSSNSGDPSDPHLPLSFYGRELISVGQLLAVCTMLRCNRHALISSCRRLVVFTRIFVSAYETAENRRSTSIAMRVIWLIARRIAVTRAISRAGIVSSSAII